MNSKPVTIGLSLLLTLAVVGILGAMVLFESANMRHTEQLAAGNRSIMEQLSASNRDLMLGDRDILLSNVEVMKNLVRQQELLVEQQRANVELQNRVTGFSDESIKSRRAQGVRAEVLIDLCNRGEIHGKLCEALPDPATLEILKR